MNKPSLTEFTAWAKAHKQLALTVCKTQAFAQIERERVDAYIKPIFDSYEFYDDNKQRITDRTQLYLSTDEQLVARYYEECDRAHREHGYNGEPGTCPALIAEHLAIQAENALLDAACKLIGLPKGDLYVPCLSNSGGLEGRERALKIFLGACLNT